MGHRRYKSINGGTKLVLFIHDRDDSWVYFLAPNHLTTGMFPENKCRTSGSGLALVQGRYLQSLFYRYRLQDTDIQFSIRRFNYTIDHKLLVSELGTAHWTEPVVSRQYFDTLRVEAMKARQELLLQGAFAELGQTNYAALFLRVLTPSSSAAARSLPIRIAGRGILIQTA